MSLARQLIYRAGKRIAAFQSRDLMLPKTQRTQTVGRLLASAGAGRCASLERLTGGGPIIVLAPHPDDETLGCGALLAACADAGIDAYVFILTDGSLSHPGARNLTRHRLGETISALRALGLKPQALRRASLGDGRALLDNAGMRRVAARIGRFATKVNAKRLFVAWSHDPHPDHMAAALVAERARRAAPRLAVLQYPIRGRFLPPRTKIAASWSALRFDARPFLPRKRRAMGAYRSQTTPQIATRALAFRFRRDEHLPFLGPNEIFFTQGR
jgi:LmbE family N-acetylglucosaminyl deacetylase